VHGAWDPDALRRAACDLAETHEILRTSFNLADFRRPMQLVHKRVEIVCHTEDLRELPEVDRSRRVREVIGEQKATPFDWRAPMLRLHALRTAEHSFELVQTHFHGVLDGLSLHLMTGELLTRYDQRRAGGPAAPAGPAPLPYRRYVEAELAAQADRGTHTFWRRTLDTAAPLLLAGGQTPRMSGSRVLEFATIPTEEFDRAAAAAGVPLKSLLFATHVRALARACERGDVVTGLVVSGRLGEEGGDRTLGLFLNTVPVCATVDDEPVAGLAGRLWRTEQTVMGRHALPLVDIQQAAGRRPLFDTFFNFMRFEDHTPAAGGTRVVREHGDTVDVGFALATHVDVAGGRTRLIVQYDEVHVAVARIDAYVEWLRAEVTGLVGDPRPAR
jgi:hypothetical protein